MTREPWTTQDGPNVRKARAPEVTHWTVVPFDGYVWHLPAALVEQLEREARAQQATATERVLRAALAPAAPPESEPDPKTRDRLLRQHQWCVCPDKARECLLHGASEYGGGEPDVCLPHGHRVAADAPRTPPEPLDVERLSMAASNLGWYTLPTAIRAMNQRDRQNLAAEYARLAAGPQEDDR